MAATRKVLQGRFYCPACRIVATVIRDARVVNVCCPKCGGAAEPASGDEA